MTETFDTRWLSYRLRTWANARERRNPFGHGKTGTALLRAAAEEIDRLQSLSRDSERSEERAT